MIARNRIPFVEWRRVTLATGCVLSFKDYESYINGPLWQNDIRPRVMERDNWTCQICGDKATEAHHWSYGDDVLSGKNIDDIQAVCTGCHRTGELAIEKLKRDGNPLDELRHAFVPTKCERDRRVSQLQELVNAFHGDDPPPSPWKNLLTTCQSVRHHVTDTGRHVKTEPAKPGALWTVTNPEFHNGNMLLRCVRGHNGDKVEALIPATAFVVPHDNKSLIVSCEQQADIVELRLVARAKLGAIATADEVASSWIYGYSMRAKALSLIADEAWMCAMDFWCALVRLGASSDFIDNAFEEWALVAQKWAGWWPEYGERLETALHFLWACRLHEEYDALPEIYEYTMEHAKRLGIGNGPD